MIIDITVADFIGNYFDKIFVVSIERAKDRQKKVGIILEPLPYEFFMGVDKENLNLAKLEQQGLYHNSRALKLSRQSKGIILGHIACSLSHRALYQHILSNHFQRVLVFEDDVVPLRENLLQLPETLGELPENWDLIYLGSIKRKEITLAIKLRHFFYRMFSTLGLKRPNRVIANNLLPVMYSPHLRTAGYPGCTHAYALTFEAAGKLLTIQTPVAFNAGNVMSYTIMNGQLKTFIAEPNFFDQE
ncbi:MAG: glycosyltransferase family 25 protein [Chitinophagaceae bacterium]